MAKPYRLLRIARVVFLVLAYLTGGLSLVFGGVAPLIVGGEATPIIAGGPHVPARLLGVWNILVSAPLTFVFFYIPSGVIHLLLELREQPR